MSAGSSEKFVARWPRGNQEPRKRRTFGPPSRLRTQLLLLPRCCPSGGYSTILAYRRSHSSEPKKIHTIIIRSDGSGQTDISAAAVAHSATNTRAPAAKPSTAAAR